MLTDVRKANVRSHFLHARGSHSSMQTQGQTCWGRFYFQCRFSPRRSIKAQWSENIHAAAPLSRGSQRGTRAATSGVTRAPYGDRIIRSKEVEQADTHDAHAHTHTQAEESSLSWLHGSCRKHRCKWMMGEDLLSCDSGCSERKGGHWTFKSKINMK